MPDYKSTLNLPKTAFPMKADLPVREPQMLAQWEAEDLYGQMRRAPHPNGPFILHDGPPYANGDIHIGHALNKILKDLIVRYRAMNGFDAPYVPGWDCHGMPIEHQLFKELKIRKHQIGQAEFRAKARAYAERYVGIQREQFKRLGVLGDWSHPYMTMSKDYELTILRVFRELIGGGYIYRGKKPVYWCATCETALAEAEVEYEDKQDTSIYVSFPIARVAMPLVWNPGWEKATVIVWTTTPWTLLANVALCFHPGGSYSLVQAKDRASGEKRYVVIAADLVDSVLEKCNLEKVKTIQTIDGKSLAAQPVGGAPGTNFRHPYGRSDAVAVMDEGTSLTDGTGVIHIAPGHGQEDYAIGQRYKLDVFSPVDAGGRYTNEVPQWAGQSVWEANPKIVADLQARSLLFGQEVITHSYPHCWRCKQPVIFRATPQWFLSVEHQGLRGRLLEATTRVTWVPSAGRNRMSGMLEGRPDWCLSRQRYWGTPIPILHCTRCDQPLLDVRVIQQLERALSERGIDAWFSASPSELAPDATCPTCSGRELRMETDILDVWFDSGVSHEAVLKARPQLRWPADLYLEGSDQHRGWFQVSLIPSVALHNEPPYRSVLTHGFVMDGEGRKMSKSLGNVISPQEVMRRYGADILRLWVASCDYREDVRISEEILAQVAENYRKIRNTFRYLLANLYDFDPRRDGVDLDAGRELDRWALHRCHELVAAAGASYDAYQFHEVSRAVYQFCVADLSAFYLDALKDRLYTEAASSTARRCAQSVLYAILQSLVKLLAPILVMTTDEVWQLMRGAGWVTEASVHLAAWPQAGRTVLDADGTKRWDALLSVRAAVMKALEEQRARGVIGSPLEARVTLQVSDPHLRHLIETHRETLAEAFVVSQIDVQANGSSAAGAGSEVPGLAGVSVERAPGSKCDRCWKHLTTVGSDASHPTLCARCAAVVQTMRSA